jgi:hypothetical protein
MVRVLAQEFLILNKIFDNYRPMRLNKNSTTNIFKHDGNMFHGTNQTIKAVRSNQILY